MQQTRNTIALSQLSDAVLIYDKGCPMCDHYCHMIRIKPALHLLNAREHPEVVAQLAQLGFDIDQGMVLKYANNYYFGADALHMLALLGSERHFLSQFNAYLFRSKMRATLIYPILRALRNTVLKILGITKLT